MTNVLYIQADISDDDIFQDSSHFRNVCRKVKALDQVNTFSKDKLLAM